MNKIAKAGIGIAAVAAVAATGALVAFAWGPSRTTYTLEKPATKVTFNSITNNNKEVGDERYFVSASPYTGDASKNHWTDNTQVENGKEYVVRMYVHNNAASNLNLTAKDVKAYVVLPTTTGTEITVSGKITSSNADPVSVWDETTFKSKNGEKFNLAYVDGTAKYYNNAGTFKLGTSVFTNSGQLLGYSKMDGNIPGCIQYSGYLTFHVKAQFASKPELTIQKEVKILGDSTWSEQVKAKAGDTVRYRIHVKNTGNVQLTNVHIRDILPTGLTYVKGSTLLANTTNPNGISVSDNITKDGGINVGTYNANGDAWVYFNATVNKSVSEECGNTILRNVAQTSAGSSTGTREDTADVIVEGKTCKDGFTIDKKVKNAAGEYVETANLKAGETAHYRIAFKNTGDNELKNVVLKDTLPSKMTYVKGSTKIGSTAAGDGIVSGEGLNIGNVAAGKSVYIYFDAKVNAGVGEDCADATLTNIVEGKYNNDDKTSKTDTAVVKVDGKECKDGFIINKMVQADGGKEWSENVTVKAGDKVRYRIQFKNTGETTLKNVVIRDLLPSNMTYVKGSTILYNSANTNGKTLADGIVSTEGINIGNYAKGTEATIYFYATVNASLKDNCNDSTLTNTVKGKYNNDSKTEKSDTADVTVPGKDCKEPTPTPYLPETGAGEIISGVLGLAAVSTAAGYYIISRKK
ncbi:MAG: DUF11 domain-containing protein [Candidatus Saccharibacteria bacterium]|nr:DUF11 domain-containing protein [Candidatus Saccharibacteria bacterium]